jgi:signal transduction histidine kinase
MAKGDHMEIVVDGYAIRDHWFQGASAVNLGPQPLPAPLALKADKAVLNQHHALLVTFRGLVISHSSSVHDFYVNGRTVPVAYNVLTVECENQPVRMAFLPGPDVFGRFPVGSWIEATGGARIHDFHRPDNSLYLSLWVDGPGDVKLLSSPPLWQQPRFRKGAFVAAAVTFAALILIGGVVLVLRWRIKLLRQSEDALRINNAELEKRVQERTHELNLALDRERELGEMKSNFVSLVSHEFRTPLGVIMSAAEVLTRYHERLSPDKRVRHLNMIVGSTRNLAKLIEEVLLLGRVEDQRMQFTPVPVDLEKFSHFLVDEIQSATGGSCPIHFEVSGPLEGAVSDQSILRHILSNLLSNACKYSEPSSPVTFQLSREEAQARFVISDHGIGIPEVDQRQLFTSFTRGSNVGERPGTGLGLVVVKRCVELHDGSMQLISVLGKGTTVTVLLPMFKGKDAP